MKFDEIKMNHLDEVREKLIELYDRDIKEAECHFSSRNFVFVFSNGCKPAVLRVSINTSRTRDDIMSELMWVDDLKNTVSNIANMIPSKQHSIVEEFHIGEDHFCVTQFRKANGAVALGEDRDDAYFYQCGKLLGKIHKASREEQKSGFQFKRCKWYEKLSCDCSAAEKYLAPEVIATVKECFEKTKSFPITESNFGMIHGDYQPNNIYLDWETLWIFDFDDCCYGYYMMDIASFMHLAASDMRYRPEMDRKDVYYNILKLFREGYETENLLEDSEWDKMDDYLKNRISETLNLLAQEQWFPEHIKTFLLNSQASYLSSETSIVDTMESRFRKFQQDTTVKTSDIFNADQKVKK